MKRTASRSDARSAGRAGERGAALLIVLMVIIVLFSMGVAALWTATGNTKISANLNLRQQALYVAEAGIERARAHLNANPLVANLLAGSNPALDDIPSDANPDGAGAVMIAFIDPSNPALGVENLLARPYPPAEFGRTGGTAQAPTATSMGTYTVWIRNDSGEIRRDLFTQDSNQVVTLRSRGVATDGLTQVTLDVTVGFIPGSPGAPGTGVANPSSLCQSGKNACDENNSTVAGVVAQ